MGSHAERAYVNADIRLFIALLTCKQTCAANKLVRTTHIMRFFFVAWCLRDDAFARYVIAYSMYTCSRVRGASYIRLHRFSRCLVSA
jgi:hypothetical protein